MLSHLRFHRRAPSNPSSPLPDQTNPWDANSGHDHSPVLQDTQRAESRPRSSHAQQPPTLPPIARVTSADSEPSFPLRDDRPLHTAEDQRSPPARPPSNLRSSGFIGGVALRNYQRDVEAPERTDSAGHHATRPDSHLTRTKAPPPPIITGAAQRPSAAPTQVAGKVSKSTSFVTPTDIQHYPGATGKRPSGTRLTTEPVLPSAVAAQPPPETQPQRPKKSLPFLKNPVSALLLRRRAGQNAPEYSPPPVEPEPANDPRIRGTRVHDFSAPRPRRVLSPTGSPTTHNESVSERAPAIPPIAEIISSPLHIDTGRIASDGSLARHASADAKTNGFQRDTQSPPMGAPLQKQLSLDKPLPSQPQSRPTSSVPGGEMPVKTTRPASSIVSRASSAATARLLASNPSTMTAKSSRPSTRASVASALPKHMMSTSSRFSFDMMGSAKQEQLLEERHRQRQAEKKTTDPRDSTFDEYDDEFDYDAMMDDDGLEERVPGVNADWDEEEDYLNSQGDDLEEEVPMTGDADTDADPDNDQENFAGFVFQRSNPASALASPQTPGALATPRDANGKVIGFAMSMDTTSDTETSTTPLENADPSLPPVQEDPVRGLGIDKLPTGDDAPDQAPSEITIPSDFQLPETHSGAIGGDDIYFDDGLADELNFEPDGETFDESIFDNNDTDQYGRPIPGAFAQAQAERAAKRESSRRESDMTSHMSARSILTTSTAHTSLSAVPQPLSASGPKEEVLQEEPVLSSHGLGPVASVSVPGQDLAYQAALAEAAQKAEAAGKFRRASSPALPADLTITSPTDSSGSQAANPLDSYEDDSFSPYEAMDDFDFDDDAIIAEANASALAHDSDGWYGQEFGFYAAPLPVSQYGHGPSASAKADNLQQFGGFFAAAGQSINRTVSGRVVSREPNLTPITERSEYSNRNSMMSLFAPPALNSDGRNSVSLQSPGLAQLAMMADDDNMSISALLKLRSRAWGGSQASLASSREGSPRSERPAGESPWGPGPAFPGPQNVAGHGRKNSAFSLWSNSDMGSTSGSPTLTTAIPQSLSAPPVPIPGAAMPPGAATRSVSEPIMPPPLFSPTHVQPGPLSSGLGIVSCPPVQEDDELDAAGDGRDGSSERRDTITSPLSPTSSNVSPVQQHARRPGMGHRHKGSADSISYRKEEESGGWVMERRRTAESGEVEILEREVVGNGRI